MPFLSYFCPLFCCPIRFRFIVDFRISLPLAKLILILNDYYSAHDVKDKVQVKVQKGHMLDEDRQMRMIQSLEQKIFRLMVLMLQQNNSIIHQ